MESPIVLAATTVPTLVLVVAVAAVAALWRDRARTRRALERAETQSRELGERLDAISAQLAATSASLIETREAAYLITDAGLDRPEPNVPDRLVLSATLGEPLVKAVALGHGVARALAPESRNRIWFEMRREVRRARKQRRRETRDAWRQLRAEQRSAEAA